MRIGTWNLDGRWSKQHRDLLLASDCDVWLLTEVSRGVALMGYERHTTTGLMKQNRHWASVYSTRPLQPIADPHPSSAAAMVDGITYCSSVLPWRSCGPGTPWIGMSHGARVRSAVEQLRDSLRAEGLVWGGDWNQAMHGPDYAGSIEGKEHIAKTLAHFDLKLPTATLTSRLEGHATIDHIGVRASATVLKAEKHDGTGLSDHDLYVVELGG